MAEVPIPAAHHVVRHCRKNWGIRENGTVVAVYPEFFKLRAKVGPQQLPEKYLSAAYFEFYEGDDQYRMYRCLEGTPVDIKDDEAMVRLNVGSMHEQGKACKKQMRITHAGNDHHPAYAKIIGTGMPGNLYPELVALLAAKSIVEIAMARDIRKKPGTPM
jgi:hypothetical protein